MASGLENIETIESPFRRFVTTIGVFPTAFTDAMTYYECLAYLVKYLDETVIPAVNENAEALAELQQLYIQLKSYVDNYFANLDVQEEINNKLDQMTEDGTLQEIITSYIQANVAWCFDTVAGMKASTNLINGSYAQTLGYHAKNDGGAAIYKIRTITNDDVVDEATIIELADDNLIAELIVGENIIPEQFGCYGDGTTDDTTAFHKALVYSDKTFKCIKATKKYKLTVSFNVETLANSYVNIDGETPTHTYAQSVSGEYGYNIGGSIILGNVPLFTGSKTKGLRGAIRNLTIIPVTKDSSVTLFNQVHFVGFRLDNLSVFYFKYVFNDCNIRVQSFLTNSTIMYLETLINGGNFTEGVIENNYINGISTRNSSCFNAPLFGTKITNNFIDYFGYIYNDQVNNRVQADFISSNNTYDWFGTFFGLKTDSTQLNSLGINSVQDTFSNWTEEHAINLRAYNEDISIKSPSVKPNSARRTFVYCSSLYMNESVYIYIDDIRRFYTNNALPVLDITFGGTNQTDRRVNIANLDYIPVDSLPTSGYIGQHVIYDGNLYCYIASNTWKQLSNA